MNILLVSSDNNKTSGAFLCLVELARQLQEQHQVIVILPKNGDGESLLNTYRIQYMIVPMLSWVIFNELSIKSVAKYIIKWLGVVFNLYALLRLCWIMYRYKIDIVHNNTIFNYVGSIAANLMNKPVIWHIRENLQEAFHSKLLCNSLGYRLINNAAYVIFTSQQLKSSYPEIYGNANSVIYDGVSINFYSERTILENSSIHMAIIGHLNQNKNQRLLIEVLGNLYKKGIRNFTLSIVGDGELREDLETLVEQLGLIDHIVFLGRVQQVNRILENTDILISTAISEAFGRTLVEGMLSGCLTISAFSDYNAGHEIITNGETGLLFNIKYPDELESILYKIITSQDKEIYRNIAQNGQQWGLVRYTEDINFQHILGLYNLVIKGK